MEDFSESETQLNFYTYPVQTHQCLSEYIYISTTFRRRISLVLYTRLLVSYNTHTHIYNAPKPDK